MVKNPEEILSKIEEFNNNFKKMDDRKMLWQTIEFVKFLSDRMVEQMKENFEIKQKLEELQNGKRD